MKIPNPFDSDFSPVEGYMLILTTIYFTELKSLDNDGARKNAVPLEPSAVKSRELFRELLGLYEGRNRVLPIDRES